jgi:hypothetical protein
MTTFDAGQRQSVSDRPTPAGNSRRGPRSGFRLASPRAQFGVVVCVALAALTVGCAPAHHSHRDRCHCIEYGYCPPAPLPYTTYCGCPTPVAAGHARGVGPAEPRTGESAVPHASSSAAVGIPGSFVATNGEIPLTPREWPQRIPIRACGGSGFVDFP